MGDLLLQVVFHARMAEERGAFSITDIIEDLNANTKLQKLFGNPVSESLMIVADQYDLRIEYAGEEELTEKESELLIGILEETIQANIRM